MPPVDPNSNRSIAKKLGVSHAAVNKARKRGVDGKDADAVLEQWSEKTSRIRPDSPEGVSGGEREANAALKWEQVRYTRNKNNREEKKVRDAAEVEGLTRELHGAVKNQVITFPDECGAAIAAEFGIDAALFRQALKRHLFAHLDSNSKALKEAA